MYQCHLCDFTDVRVPRFEAHMMAHDKIKKFKCPTCQKQFDRLRKTIDHSLTHEKKPVIEGKKQKRSKHELLSKIDAADIVPLVELLVPLKCAKCGQIFTNNLDYGFHSRKHSDVGLFQCHLCNFQSKFKTTFESHIRNHEGSKKFKCTICSEQYDRIVTMVRHKLTHVNKNTVKCKMNLNTRKINFFSDYDIEDPESFTVYPKELLEPLKCQTCEELFSNNVDFALHSREHNPHGILTCHICDYKDSNKHAFELHVRDHDGIKKFKCPTCNKQFRQLLKAVEHKNSHENKKGYECDLCGKKYVMSSSLNAHKNREHLPTQKLYSCKDCKMNFSSDGNLQAHNFRRHRERCTRQGCVCDTCGQRFFDVAALKRHRLGHDNVRNFACKSCPKTFLSKNNLRVHLRVHSGKKEYTCNYCGKQFGYSSGFAYHLKIHTGEKPYSCEGCDRKFVSKGNMRLHMKRVHDKTI